MKSALVVLALISSGCAPPAEQGPPPGDGTLPADEAAPGGAEAFSLLGGALRPPALPPGFRDEQEALLAQALATLDANPDDVEARIWTGRRTAYLGRYREALAIYDEALARHPDEPRLHRHRGHRLITVRRLDEAAADLERAAELVRGRPDEVEPDGLPNARNLPRSTLQSNIHYHLGLARYLQGDFERALAAYRDALAVSTNDDMLVATSHWLYMTLRRLGRDEEAAAALEPIGETMDVIENHDYHRLLLVYRGDLDAETVLRDAATGDEGLGSATVGYGIGNRYLYEGDPERAEEIFREVIEGDTWAAFGYIAAEAELARNPERGRGQKKGTGY